MNIKIIKLFMLVLLVGIFTVGCSNILPTKMPLDDSLKEILTSKGENYNFLNDELFLETVDEYARSIPNIDVDEVKYAIGNLDDDNYPELAIFMDKDPDDVNSKTELVVYKFNGDSYVILDRIHMNHDSSNHLMEIGKISEDQNGIFLSNNVGARSTATYGFILKDRKLKSILNENKISLISLEAENEIKDIDDDGILEFSIYTVNPEASNDKSESKDDMMSIWYKWDGKDGGKVVQTDTKTPYSKSKVSKGLLKKYKAMNIVDILPSLEENIDDYNPKEVSQILKNYMESLEEGFSQINQSPLLEKLLEESDKHGLSIERLNDITYISRDKVLDSSLRDYIRDNLKLGYKLVETEGMFYFILDNQMFVDKYGSNMSKEFLNYLKIKSFNSNEPYLKDGALVIDRDALAERILAIENYRLRFPFSQFVSELDSVYTEYVRTFILGSVNTPNYDLNTNLFSEGSIALFSNIVTDHPNTHFADVLNYVVNELKSNANTITVDLKENLELKI